MIEIQNLTKIYNVGKSMIHAVDNVSFSIRQGEIVGLVGESGSGKSTLAKMMMGLIAPTSGQTLLDGKNIACFRKTIATQMQMIFQDPFSSLNPRMPVGEIIDEPLKIHRKPSRVDELLDLVSLPRNVKGRFPHEFSGGQRQRIAIARAIALNPRFLLCDEPISALDVSIQAQIVNLLLRLHTELDLTYLFISHDLTMVRYLTTRILVMHKGTLVESAPTETLFSQPAHPYTKHLLSLNSWIRHG